MFSLYIFKTPHDQDHDHGHDRWWAVDLMKMLLSDMRPIRLRSRALAPNPYNNVNNFLNWTHPTDPTFHPIISTVGLKSIQSISLWPWNLRLRFYYWSILGPPGPIGGVLWKAPRQKPCFRRSLRKTRERERERERNVSEQDRFSFSKKQNPSKLLPLSSQEFRPSASSRFKVLDE